MKKLLLLTPLLLSSVACADAMTIQMNAVNKEGVGVSVGTVSVEASPHGVVLIPNLKALAPGVHGFHVHQNASCEPAKKGEKVVPALGAGGHYDPKETNQHGTPWGDGHLGDLPPLFVESDGTSVQPVLAPRLKIADLKGRSLMVHAGGDNHSDHPNALGGGGARVACGVIES